MKENPKEMVLAKLDVLVMPNGEILCGGQFIGFVAFGGEVSLGRYLSDFRSATTGEPVNAKGEKLK